jgi:hypothetical protein
VKERWREGDRERKREREREIEKASGKELILATAVLKRA